MLHPLKHRIVALHQVRNHQQSFFGGLVEHCLPLFGVHGQGFFTNYVLARIQSTHSLLVVQKWGRGNIDQVDVGMVQQLLERIQMGSPKAFGSGNGLLAFRTGNGHKLTVSRLHKLLHGK